MASACSISACMNGSAWSRIGCSITPPASFPAREPRASKGIRHGETPGGCGTRSEQHMRRTARLDPGDLTMVIRSVALLLGVILPLFLGDAARAATEEF